MKKVLLFFTILSMFGMAKAQAPVILDDATIKDIVTNEKEYYNDIIQIYLADDPYLRLDDIALVYYGHVYSPDYLTTNADEEKLKEYSVNGDYDKMYETATKILKINPVSLNALFYAWLSSSNLEKPKEVQTSYVTKYIKIIDMICEYGNGKTPETAFRIISIYDQDHILYGKLKAESVLSSTLDKESLCNIIRIEPTEKYPHPVVYFDISLFLTNGIK